jgi:MFS family permease
MLRDPVLSAGLAMNVLVMAVMMATLVVGPFYLTHGLELETSSVALAMSAGPVVAAVAGVPAGRFADRLGGTRSSIIGLAMAAAGCLGVAATAGIAGYVGALVTVTAGYALFQAANNAAVMTRVRPGERGLASGLLNLSRNLGLIAGASAMGALFAFGTGAVDVAAAPAEAVVGGMRLCFAVAAGLVLAALALAVATRPGSVTGPV